MSRQTQEDSDDDDCRLPEFYHREETAGYGERLDGQQNEPSRQVGTGRFVLEGVISLASPTG